MHIISARYTLWALLLFVVSSDHVLAENVIANQSFEVAGPGGTTDSAGWVTSTLGVSGVANERSSMMASDGEWSHYLSTRGVSGNGGALILGQRGDLLGIPSLMENQTISASFDVKYFETRSSGHIVELGVLRSDGGLVDTVDRVFPASDEFIRVETPPITVPPFGDEYPLSDAYFVQIVFRVESSSSPIHYAEAFIDNVVVDAVLVPEPSYSIWLLIGGVLGMARYKFRRIGGSTVPAE